MRWLLQLEDTTDEAGWLWRLLSPPLPIVVEEVIETMNLVTPPAKTRNTHSYGGCHQAAQLNEATRIINCLT